MLIGEATPIDPLALKLETRKKTFIPNVCGCTYSPEKLMFFHRAYAKEFGGRIKLRSLDGAYDCMGMVFAARRTTIDIDVVTTILNDDGYRQINATEIEVGDIILYRSTYGPAHVGWIAEMPKVRLDELSSTPQKFRVLSKWGPAGEYFHFAEDVPLMFGKPFQFFTDRKLP